MTINELTTHIDEGSEKLYAKVAGYYFSLFDDKWKLDKNNTIYVSKVANLLAEPYRSGFRKTLAFFASNYSSAYSRVISECMQRMLLYTSASEINETALINYRSSLTTITGPYLATIRIFLARWNRLGYPGIDDDLVSLLYSWRIKGGIRGDAVKRQDPVEGPLTDNELQSFNEGAVRAYESSLISLTELAMSLVTSNTGRRPIQISHLRVVDIISGKNEKGETVCILNVPRAKQGLTFRASFKPYAMSQDLWTILNAQANFAIKESENAFGFELQETDRLQVPLFPDIDVAKSVSSPHEFYLLVITDKLHIKSSVITDVLQFVADAAEIHSERTGELLSVNARRFRYTTGTRAAREGFGELVIAELLDHTDTQNAGVYVKNIPEHVKRLDEAVGFQLAPYAQAFAGVLVDSEKDAKRGNDPSSRIRSEAGEGVGTCGEYGFCDANVPVPCYTCMHFQPWLDGPHKEIYQFLLDEREKIKETTGDLAVAAVLDRTIIAVAEVVVRCEKRRMELNAQGKK